MKKVSVIVPVYNGGKFLDTLINCFLRQDHDNFEVVFIDDGSQDNSREIIMRYAVENPIFKYFYQENAGAAAARNNGLEKATGDYVTFVDCDDEITDDYISTMAKICDGGKDVCISSYLIKEQSGKITSQRIVNIKPLGLLANVATCGKMYRKDIITDNNIAFLTGSALFEDAYFTLSVLNVASKTDVVEKPLYHQIVNENSITHTKGKDLSVIEGTIKTFEKIKDIGFKDEELLDYFFVKSAIYCILFAAKKQEKNALYSTYDKLFDWIKANTKKSKYLSLFGDYGEAFSVKLIIFVFRLLQKAGLAKIMLRVFSMI